MSANKQQDNAARPAHRRVNIRDQKNRPSAQQEKIVKEAVRQFRANGYRETSLSEIARNVGLDQSSLYYWFKSKEAVLDSILSPALYTDALAQIRELDTTWSIKLYKLIVNDIVIKCELPIDFIELEELATNNRDLFTDFIESYREQYATLVEFLQVGAKAGEFTDAEADMRAVNILSINEGLQHYYHAKLRGQFILGDAGYQARDLSPIEIGRLSAKVVLPAVCAQPVDIDAIREQADAL